MPLNAAEFFWFARERYQILLQRRVGMPWPWTDDPILQQFRFCNVFREDDRTTVWFHEHVRNRLAERRDVMLATVAFRWFNRIETCERLEDLFGRRWNNREVRRRLHGVKPLVTGAYMIKTPANMDKLTGILWCINHTELTGVWGAPTLELAHEALMRSPYLGPFMAYEVITDLAYTKALRHASRDTWANPGPGCQRGLAWVTGIKVPRRQQLDVMRELLALAHQKPLFGEQLWPDIWPKWDMRTVEHTLCEYDKYRRGCAGQTLKRRYAPNL